jgi:hypothetical protein
MSPPWLVYTSHFSKEDIRSYSFSWANDCIHTSGSQVPAFAACLQRLCAPADLWEQKPGSMN